MIITLIKLSHNNIFKEMVEHNEEHEGKIVNGNS